LSFRAGFSRESLFPAVAPEKKPGPRPDGSSAVEQSLAFGVLNWIPAVVRQRLPERGASGSVQRGPANPARPGREQRYREHLGCRRSPEVPRTGKSWKPL